MVEPQTDGLGGGSRTNPEGTMSHINLAEPKLVSIRYPWEAKEPQDAVLTDHPASRTIIL